MTAGIWVLSIPEHHHHIHSINWKKRDPQLQPREGWGEVVERESE